MASWAPFHVGIGEIASLGTLESGKRQLILEKPKGYPEPELRRGRLFSRGQAPGDGRRRRGHRHPPRAGVAGVAAA